MTLTCMSFSSCHILIALHCRGNVLDALRQVNWNLIIILYVVTGILQHEDNVAHRHNLLSNEISRMPIQPICLRNLMMDESVVIPVGLHFVDFGRTMIAKIFTRISLQLSHWFWHICRVLKWTQWRNYFGESTRSSFFSHRMLSPLTPDTYQLTIGRSLFEFHSK